MNERECLSTRAVIEQAQQEVEHYRHDRTAPLVYSFELFRRACVLRDEEAWSGLYASYHTLVGAWIARLSSATEALTLDSIDAYVNAAFARFAVSVAAHNFAQFYGTRYLLAYLKRCASSVVTDAIRHAHRFGAQPEESFEATDLPVCEDMAARITATVAANEILSGLRCQVKSEAEWIVLTHPLTRASEIAADFPAHFTSIEDVYRITRVVRLRFRRNTRLRALLRQAS